MRWPWQRNRVDDVEYPQIDREAAEKAKRRAEEERKRALARNARIEELSKNMLDHEKENHFSEWFVQAMRRNQP